MKLRIRGDSLRLRLTQSEVKAVAEEGSVQETIHFGPEPQARLAYVLRSDPRVEVLDVHYEPGRIVVRAPKSVIEAWAGSDRVSLTGEQRLGGDARLDILVEKDFQCVVPREGEEDLDGFPNPAVTC